MDRVFGIVSSELMRCANSRGSFDFSIKVKSQLYRVTRFGVEFRKNQQPEMSGLASPGEILNFYGNCGLKSV